MDIDLWNLSAQSGVFDDLRSTHHTSCSSTDDGYIFHGVDSPGLSQKDNRNTKNVASLVVFCLIIGECIFVLVQ